MSKMSGLSLEEIKKSGYLISPDKTSEKTMELYPESKQRSQRYLDKLKTFHKKTKNPNTKKILEEMHKEHELEMFKSGLLRLG